MKVDVIDGKIVGFLTLQEFSEKQGITPYMVRSAIRNECIAVDDVLRIADRVFIREDAPIGDDKPHGHYLGDSSTKEKILTTFNQDLPVTIKAEYIQIGKAINQALLERDGRNSDFVSIFHGIQRGIYRRQNSENNPLSVFFDLEMNDCCHIGELRWSIVERAKEIIRENALLTIEDLRKLVGKYVWWDHPCGGDCKVKESYEEVIDIWLRKTVKTRRTRKAIPTRLLTPR